MATVSTIQVQKPQSVWNKLALGAAMGTGVGLCIGLIGATVQVFRAGPGPNGLARTFAQYMGTSAATFGFFLSIGTVIRTEGISERDQYEQIYRKGKPRTIILERLKNMPSSNR